VITTALREATIVTRRNSIMLKTQNLRSQFSKLSVLVLGDHCLDRDCIGTYSGFAREKEGLPIFRIDRVNYKPGGAGYLASSFAVLGIETIAAGVWGDREDSNRLILEEKLNASRIDTSGMVEGARTPTFEKYYLPSGEHIWRADVVPEEIKRETEENMLKILQSLLEDIQFIVVTDYDETGKGVCTDRVLELVSDCNKTRFGASRERIMFVKGKVPRMMAEKCTTLSV
jgi:bifunctional ADP-heptose synthase (sugar kinase/adenylyltransferase)